MSRHRHVCYVLREYKSLLPDDCYLSSVVCPSQQLLTSARKLYYLQPDNIAAIGGACQDVAGCMHGHICAEQLCIYSALLDGLFAAAIMVTSSL